MTATIRQSGALWTKSSRQRLLEVRTVCRILRRKYGLPTFGNPSDPLDDLIYVLISTRTSLEVAARTFGELRQAFPTWDEILRSTQSRLRRVLKPAGLSEKKSWQIRSALTEIRRAFGRCELNTLSTKDDAEVHAFLIRLPGVSDKVAKCVMMYAMGRSVLPVDVHVHRVAGRLGWIDRKSADQCHSELEAIVPPPLRYAFHVDCIAHGRAICRSVPRCKNCPIRGYCDFYKVSYGQKKANSR
jgi:endonuclease III